MQVVEFSHEQHIRYRQHCERADEVEPMREHVVRAQVDEAQRDGQLHRHVQHSDLHVADFQFVGHYLVGVLAVRFAEVFVQHDAVHYRQAAVHSVDKQEYQPRDVSGADDYVAQEEEHDECYADGADVASEAFRLAFRSEVEEAEHQSGDYRGDYEALFYVVAAAVHQRERYEHSQRIPGRDAVDAVHEVDDVGRADADYQCDYDECGVYQQVAVAEQPDALR